jgi:hypothetical protein
MRRLTTAGVRGLRSHETRPAGEAATQAARKTHGQSADDPDLRQLRSVLHGGRRRCVGQGPRPALSAPVRRARTVVFGLPPPPDGLRRVRLSLAGERRHPARADAPSRCWLCRDDERAEGVPLGRLRSPRSGAARGLGHPGQRRRLPSACRRLELRCRGWPGAEGVGAPGFCFHDDTRPPVYRIADTHRTWTTPE